MNEIDQPEPKTVQDLIESIIAFPGFFSHCDRLFLPPLGIEYASTLSNVRIETSAENLHDLKGSVFVPTMGSLHEGHLNLVRQAALDGRPVVVSIFVNPTQFAPTDDLDSYPRSLDQDARRATDAGASAIYAPSANEIYPRGMDTATSEAADFPVPEAGTMPALEDKHRPQFFGGVCLVVARLFDLVSPSKAIFGEKDWQQLLVIRQMAAQTPRFQNLVIESSPIIRDPDGLAMSSRNAYLDPGDRPFALGLRHALKAVEDETDPARAEELMHAILFEHQLKIDYATVRKADTLASPAAGAPSRALIAAHLERGDRRVRLIDNGPTKAGT